MLFVIALFDAQHFRKELILASPTRLMAGRRLDNRCQTLAHVSVPRGDFQEHNDELLM